MDESAVLRFLGLGARAGHLIYGQTLCLRGVRYGKVKLLVLDGGASENTQKTFVNACRTHHVPILCLQGAHVLGASVGKSGCRVVGVADSDFARTMMNRFGITPGKGAD